MMKEFLFGLAYLVIVVIVLRFTGRMLIRWIYGPLMIFCDKHKLNSSPWGFVIWEGLMIYEYISHTGHTLFFQYWKYTRWMSPEVYGWVILGLAALPLLIMLIQTKVIYFIPLLLAKLLGIPCLLIAALVGMPKVVGDPSDFELPTGDGSEPGGIPVYSKGHSSRQHHEEEPSGMPGYMGDKYDDQYRTSEGGEGYSTTQVDHQTAYYKGDYAPFGADGEHREYDSDYSPMD